MTTARLMSGERASARDEFPYLSAEEEGDGEGVLEAALKGVGIEMDEERTAEAEEGARGT